MFPVIRSQGHVVKVETSSRREAGIRFATFFFPVLLFPASDSSFLAISPPMYYMWSLIIDFFLPLLVHRNY